MHAPIRLLLLPGLGADARLFDRIAEHLPADRVELVTPDWIPPEEGESLRSYSRRLARALPVDARPLVVGGMSFGGQVALELARVLRPRPEAVVLIAAPSSRHGIEASFRIQGGLGGLAPRWAVRRALPILATRFIVREGLASEDAARLLGMAVDADPDFLRWGAAAAAEWSMTPRERVGMRLLRIHGRHDRVVRWREGAVDLWLDGGHLVNYTHAREIASFLDSALAATVTP